MNKDILELAKSKETKAELRSLVNAELNIKSNIPLIQAKNSQEFIGEYNKLFDLYKEDFIKIFNLKNHNTGRGEVLLAYLCDDMEILTSRNDYDINFNDHKIEVKTCIFTNSFQKNYIYDFKLGALFTEQIIKTLKEIDDINCLIEKSCNTSFSKDETKTIKKLEYSSKIIEKMRQFKIFNGTESIVDIKILGDAVFINGEKLCKLQKFTENFDSYKRIYGKKIKSFKEIEQNFIESVSNSGLDFYFFDGYKNIGSLVCKSLKSSEIHRVTQGSIRLKVF